MKKLKITEHQRKMLESKANAKLKLTESGIPHSQSPAAKVTNAFKKGKVEGFKAEGVESPTTNDINWNELVINVHEFLKQIYTNPSKEALNPYWESIGVTWDDLIQMLTAVGIIKSVKGGYRLTKIVERPAKAVKIVSKLIEKMVKDKYEVPVMEIAPTNDDEVKNSLSNQLEPKPKTGKTRHELLAIIAKKREEELARREAEKQRPIGEDNYPMGAKDDPSAPWNQSSNVRVGTKPEASPFKLVWYHQDIAIFEKDGKYYAYNVESADNSEYAEYADREESPIGRDEDGMMDVEYGDWEMTDDIVSSYVNSNFQHLSLGKGLNDWENGIEMVEITQDLAQDLMSLANYIKGPVGESLYNILSSINLAETTSTGSVGGSYVGKLSGAPIATNTSNVASEMKTTIEEVDSNDSLKGEIISLINPFIGQPTDTAMLYWLKNEAALKEIVDKIQTLQDDEWLLIIQFIITALQSAETYIETKDTLHAVSYQQAIDGLTGFIKHFTPQIGEATTTVSAGGDSGTFAYDAPVGDGGSFWTAGNKMNKKSVKEDNKAFTDTQYPNGGFVDIDKCASIGHNDKTAINGGCSTGAIDNVVKTKKSKNSVISDSSVYETVAKSTGRTVKEVKSIIDNKFNKSN